MADTIKIEDIEERVVLVARQKYYKNGEYIDTALWAIIVGDRLY